MSARVLHTTFEEELIDCVSEQEVKRIPGSSLTIITISTAVFFFSELRFTNEEELANHYGVTKIAYTNPIESY